MYPFWPWSADLEKAEIEWQIRDMAEWMRQRENSAVALTEMCFSSAISGESPWGSNERVTHPDLSLICRVGLVPAWSFLRQHQNYGKVTLTSKANRIRPIVERRFAHGVKILQRHIVGDRITGPHGIASARR